jgi:hydroxymethylglutaryl-CoA synthase
LAVIECAYSFVTDTPDFWRRAEKKFPEHGQRFTGEPGYFKHVTSAAQSMMDATHTTAADYTYAVFHQPNTKFPQRAASLLGFTPEQIAPGLLVSVIGNTYAGSALIGLSATLDVAKPGDRILMVSFGSGAGSDAFVIQVTDAILPRRDKALKTSDYIARRTAIDYATYVRYRGKLAMG